MDMWITQELIHRSTQYRMWRSLRLHAHYKI